MSDTKNKGGRPPGSPNKMTAAKDAAVKELIHKYHDPLESILQKHRHWQEVYDHEMSKTPRHRNNAKKTEAENWMLRLNEAALPYMRPKYQAIAVQGEVTERRMVIRAPESCATSAEWLERYGADKQIESQPVNPVFKR